MGKLGNESLTLKALHLERIQPNNHSILRDDPTGLGEVDHTVHAFCLVEFLLCSCKLSL